MSKHYNTRGVQGKASLPGTDDEACVTCDCIDLPLFIYLINSGILWIKKCMTITTPDIHDKKTIEFGKELVKALSVEYRRFEKD